MNPFLTTYSGRNIPLYDVEAGHIHLEDIMHSLPNICRYNGQISEHYSVAEHSVLVSSLVDPEYRKEALLHDAAEAYIGDIIAPLKQFLPEYHVIERGFEKAIAERFDLRHEPSKEYGWNEAVKLADRTALVIEKAKFLPNSTYWPEYKDIKPTSDQLALLGEKPRSPIRAYIHFTMACVHMGLK